MVPHYRNEILTDLGGEDLLSRVLMADTIYKVSQYSFDTEKLTVYPKHVTLTNNEKESKGIMGLELIENPSKANLSPI